MATDPNVLWSVLQKLAIPAGQSLAAELQQQGNPAAFAQAQENARQQPQMAQQQSQSEQNTARADAGLMLLRRHRPSNRTLRINSVLSNLGSHQTRAGIQKSASRGEGTTTPQQPHREIW